MNVDVYLGAEVMIHSFMCLVVCVGVQTEILCPGGGGCLLKSQNFKLNSVSCAAVSMGLRVCFGARHLMRNTHLVLLAFLKNP